MQKEIPDSDGNKPPAYPISSVNNALKLLLLFREQRSVRLTEACQYLGVAHSTAHRLLAMLTYHGFVRQDTASRAYVAGSALVDVGLAVVQSLDVRSHVRPHLERLSETFEETAHLAVLEGDMVQYLDAVVSEKVLRVSPRTGALVPAHCTSVGKALLAALPDEELRCIYPVDRLELVGCTAKSIVMRDALLAELDAVRKRGYAVNRAESEDDVGSVAIAFRDLGQWPAAIAIAAPMSRLTENLMVDMSKELVAVAAALGG